MDNETRKYYADLLGAEQEKFNSVFKAFTEGKNNINFTADQNKDNHKPQNIVGINKGMELMKEALETKDLSKLSKFVKHISKMEQTQAEK